MHFQSGGVDPGRDGCRVPLPWSGTAPPYGFSPAGARAEPWLPQPDGLGASSPRPSQRSAARLDARALPARPARSAASTSTGADDRARVAADADDGVLAFRRGDVVCVVNLSADAVAARRGRARCWSPAPSRPTACCRPTPRRGSHVPSEHQELPDTTAHRRQGAPAMNTDTRRRTRRRGGCWRRHWPRPRRGRLWRRRRRRAATPTPPAATAGDERAGHTSGGSRRAGHAHGEQPAAGDRAGDPRGVPRPCRGVRGGQPGHRRRAVGVRVGRRHVRRPDGRRHAADGVPDPVPRRPRPRRARPGRRHHRAGEGTAVRRASSTPTCSPSPRTPRSTSTACRSPPTASACTTTARCSRRPGSTPTRRRRRGTRSASTPSRSPTPPGRPASPSCRRTTPAAGCSPR